MNTSEFDVRTRLTCFALGLVACLLGWRWMHPSTVFATDGDPTWDSAVEQSRGSGQPAVVLFTADWCPPCRYLHANVLSRDDVESELRGHYTFVTVDLTNPTPATQARASKFGVSAIPTLIRYNADGKETARTHGLSPDGMIQWLRAGE
jgi:thiol:disulfide interchange protein